MAEVDTAAGPVGRFRSKAAVAALAGVALLAIPITGSSAPERQERTAPRAAAAPVEPRILADLAVSRPAGLAVADDGTAFVSEPASDRVVRVTSAGTEVVVQLPADETPNGLALADDGTLVIAATTGLVTVAPDGAQRTIPIAGAGEITAVDVDADGAVYASDRVQREVVRVAPDGTADPVPFTGLGEIWGIDVDDAGTVSVVDATAKDVVQRTAAGVQTDVGVADLISPYGLDITDGRMLISDGGTGRVLVREADGTTTDVLTDLASPREVALLADGTAYVAVDGTTGCRCPDGPGNITRLPAGGTASTLDLGDLRTVRTVAAAEPGTVFLTSTDGPPGYSPDNPLRRVVGDGPVEDVTVPGPDPAGVDAAPDGTAYLLRYEDAGTRVVRRAPDGTLSDVDLPAEPGLDDPYALAVDEDGRLFVALGSGYGTGGFVVVEPYAQGGPKERFRSSPSQNSGPIAASGGQLHVVVSEASDIRLLRIDLATGATDDRGPLEAPPYAFDADAAGSLYVIGDVQSASGLIHVIAPDGTTSEVRYAGERAPNQLSVGTDGTLYVSDNEIGLLALDGVAEPAAPTQPGGAVPATPVPGSSSYTG